MRLTGSFQVMSLVDLLQWVMGARKTGRLRVSHGNASREIYSREGTVVACSSNDPLVLMGQFLLFHGRITEDQLQEALKTQETTGENLGAVLVAMGAIRQDQLLQIVSSKAMETIHGLFDWEDATFEFVPDAEPTKGTIEVDLDVQEILLEGARRLDEMAGIRAEFPSRDVVLARTDRRPHASSVASPAARQIYEAIDGRRTLAEILLVCRASEYLTCSFLVGLVRDGVVSVESRPRQPLSAVDHAPDPADAQSPERARELLLRGDLCGAYDTVQQLAEAHPGHPEILSLIAEVEPKFIAGMYRGELPPEVVPTARSSDLPADADLTVEELHLLEAIDGARNVKSLVWTAPMKLARVLRTLKKLHDRGLIELGRPRELASRTD